MKFKVNNLDWTIETLNNIEFKQIRKKIAEDALETNFNDIFLFGFCCPHKQTIYLNKILCKQQLRLTLIHELEHCWLWSHGASYTSYSEDALCDTIANSIDFINKIVDKYERNIEE